MSRDGDFLSRWSARKARARVEPEPEPEVAPPVPAPPEAEATAPAKTDDEILRELGLPDPGTLVKGDDFAAFLRAGVPVRLRNRALRRLWVSDPVLANLDGLNDYDGDYTAAATAAKDLKSAYRIGLGYLRDNPPAEADDPETLADAAGQAPAVETAESGPAPGPQSGNGDGAESPRPADAAGGANPADQDPSRPSDPAAEAEAAPEPGGELRPRRMRFRFQA